MRKLELLAPARNADIGIAAIDCGADAVYIAGPRFGARQAAGNDINDIARLCGYAHRFGAKVFITFNTIIYDSELEDARKMLEELYEAGADAVIVQDMAVVELAGSIMRYGGTDPARMALHASTQCSIRTVDRAKELEASGFSRIVLEREMSLRQIKEIASSVGCEIEFFVHGALCVCYSGQCYLVLVRDKALLSLKDYNLISRLEELADAGVMSFKIEGRLKNISYVRNTVRAYSIALDRIVEKSGGKYCRASFGEVSGGFTPDLDKTFNRGYTELYIDGRRGKWASMDTAKSMGEELGTVTRLNRERTSFTIRPYGDRKVTVHNGDGLSFIEKDGSIEGVRADIGEGASVHCKSTPALFEGARIFRNYDIAFERELESKTCTRRLAAEITVSFRKASGTGTLTVTAAIEDGREARRTYTGIWNDMAANIGRMESMIRTQLSKSSGIYSFTVKDIVYGGSLPLLSSSALNSIRNDLADLLDSLAPGCSAERGGRYFTPPDGSVQYDRSAILSEAQETSNAVILSEAKNLSTDYKANISNHLAEKLYTEAGCNVTEPAYELTHRTGVELMRTRYCIRYELGLCPKFRNSHAPAGGKTAAAGTEKRSGTDAAPLYLLNNGQRFTVIFDCRSCEMVIK